MKHTEFYHDLKVAVYNNRKEVPISFVNEQVDLSTVHYLSPSNNVVVCTIVTPEGITSTGVATYNDSENKSITDLQAYSIK